MISISAALLVACGGGGSSTGGPDGGGSSGGGDVSCTYPAGTKGSGTDCAQYHNTTSAQASAINNACASDHAMSGTTCSTTNLLGCCRMTAGGLQVGTCTYTDSGSTAAQQMSGCSAAGGTWSTTP